MFGSSFVVNCNTEPLTCVQFLAPVRNVLLFFEHAVALLTSPVRLCLNDLADASGANTVLCSQLYFVPGAAAQVVQFEGAFTRTDENIFPLLCVVNRVLQHKTCKHTIIIIHLV